MAPAPDALGPERHLNRAAESGDRLHIASRSPTGASANPLAFDHRNRHAGDGQTIGEETTHHAAAYNGHTARLTFIFHHRPCTSLPAGLTRFIHGPIRMIVSTFHIIKA